MSSPPPTWLEHRLPIVTRWTLYALGAVEGQRVRRPRDPVAAWLLRRHPRLLPTFAAPSILAMIRARASIVDSMIADSVHTATALGRNIAYRSLGGGFDARWYRLRPTLRHVVVSHQEIEDPGVLGFKNEVLGTSSFARQWRSIGRVEVAEDSWCLAPAPDNADLLVVMEGVAIRLGPVGLRNLLGRLSRQAPGATFLLDLPGILQEPATSRRAVAVGGARSRWSSPHGTGAAALTTAEIHRLGFEVLDDVWLSARPELRAGSGVPICSGMEALRVLKLRSKS